MVLNLNDLVRAAGKLENVLNDLDISIKIGKPNIIAFDIPTALSFRDEPAMIQFARQALAKASVALYGELRIIFILGPNHSHSILLKPDSSSMPN
ncbi:hypothetical protein [Pedobacter frigidisoli]|uniref:hypothetical protein n=1 Tax=Pedobacter frigidisoli TaxID=2530455 RepID=UPI00292E1B2A|nr:hypothetical protein [Pedobacter frigidisoli]